MPIKCLKCGSENILLWEEHWQAWEIDYIDEDGCIEYASCVDVDERPTQSKFICVDCEEETSLDEFVEKHSKVKD